MNSKVLKRGLAAILFGFLAALLTSLSVEAQTFAYVTGSTASDAVVNVINTASNTVVATVPVGGTGGGIAVTPNNSFVYVPDGNFPSGSVHVISTATNTVVATVPVGSSPRAVAITPNGAFAYVAGGGSVWVINTATNAVVATVPVGCNPFGIAITPNGAFAYVANQCSSNVSVISTATNSVVATIPIGELFVMAVTITPNGAVVYVVGLGSVWVIDATTNTVVATVPSAGGFGIAITPNGALAYVAGSDGSLRVIDTTTNTIVTTVSPGGYGTHLYAVAITPDGAFAYVTDYQTAQGAGKVWVVSTATNSVVASVPVGPGSAGVAIAELGNTPVNQPPVADAGADQTVEATSPTGTAVTLDGSGSSDPDAGQTLTYTWTGPFPEGGGTATGVSPTVTLPLGASTLTLTVEDGHGGTATKAVNITIQDTTPPDSSIVSHPASNSNSNSASFAFDGSDIATGPGGLTFECRLDAGGFAPCASPKSYSGLADGSHSFEVRAKDPSGNTDPTPAFFLWTVDTIAPTLSATRSPLPNGAGWNNTDVTVTFTCTDAGGVATAPASPQVVSAEGAGQSVTASCTDLAGNSASLSVNDIDIDKTPPVITLTIPPAGATYLLNAGVAAAYSCTDALSGLASCAGPTANGADIDTATVGSKNFGVNAADAAGNTASVTHAYSVAYSFTGFLSPVDNLPVVNVAKAGRTIPVKWQLKDAAGNYVSALASLTSLLSAPIACGDEPSAIVQEDLTSPGSTVFRYDATTNQFIFNWQSSSGWSGCRVLQLTLADGTQHWAKFSFK